MQNHFIVWMGYPALTFWQRARCFSTFEICNPYLVRPEPIVSPFQSRMDEHVRSQWINKIGWIVFLGRFGSITSQVCLFWLGMTIVLFCRGRKLPFFPPKWRWFSCQSQCLARESTNLSQNRATFPLTLFQSQTMSVLAYCITCLQINMMHIGLTSFENIF